VTIQINLTKAKNEFYEGRANINYNLFVVQNAARSVKNSNMWKVEVLFQGHSPTWCLRLRSFVSCEEDERNEGTRLRGTAHYNQIPD